MSRYEKINNYFIFFITYSVIGWIYETILEVFVYRWGFSNRGFLFGPYLPIYGFGALLFIVCLYKVKQKDIRIKNIKITPLLVFLGCAIIATCVELLASYVLELTTGKWLWNYDNYAFNFQNRIALNPSVRFGLGGLLFLYIIQPKLVSYVDRTSKNVKSKIFIILFVILILDLFIKSR